MDQTVPLYYFRGLRTVQREGRWTVEGFEDYFGKPKDYPTRTMRVWILIPDQSIVEAKVHELERLFEEYAPAHNLEVLISYIDVDADPHFKFINPSERAPFALNIDVISAEAMNEWLLHGLVPLDELLGQANLDYTGAGAVSPVESIEMDRILGLGGRLALKPDADASMFPYTHALLFVSIRGQVERNVYTLDLSQSHD